MRRRNVNTSKGQNGERRKRPWLRRVGVVAGCLLAGAIINILVAWGCALFITPDARAHKYVGGYVRFNDKVVSVWTMGSSGFQYTRVSYDSDDSFQWDVTATPPDRCLFALERSVRAGSEFLSHDARGWPLLNMYSEIHDWRTNESRIHGGIWLTPSESHGSSGTRVLPLIPIFPAFAVNTAIYSFVFFVLVMSIRIVHRARRHRRVKRRQCPDCGYDLRGTDHGKCPECGEAVSGVKCRQPNSQTR